MVGARRGDHDAYDLDRRAVGGIGGAGGAAPAAQERIFVDQWSPTESVLIIADADGANRRKLVAGSERDYNASFSFDDEWVVFTSERHGSADIFRVRTDGMGLERLTDDPAFDDQAALSPDGRSLAFVSTRGAGSTDIHLLDLQSGEVRNLTETPGGDYRPSWSPDGRMLAFSSDRGKPPRMAAGRWEHLHEPGSPGRAPPGRRWGVVTAGSTSATRAGFRPYHRTAAGSSSASGPGGAVRTTAPGWPSGTPTARIRGVSSAGTDR